LLPISSYTHPISSLGLSQTRRLSVNDEAEGLEGAIIVRSKGEVTKTIQKLMHPPILKNITNGTKELARSDLKLNNAQSSLVNTVQKLFKSSTSRYMTVSSTGGEEG
jgi:hypothetical protein